MTRNSIFLTLEKAAHMGFGMLVVVAAARLLGPEGFGHYAFVTGLSSLFIPLMDPGLNNRAIKQVASGQEEGRRAVEDAVRFRLGAAPVALLAMAAVAWGLERSGEVLIALLLIGTSTVLMGLGDSLNAIFKGLRRPVFGMLLVGGLNLLLCVSGIWAMVSGAGLVGLAVCFIACRALYLVSALVVAAAVAPDYGPRFRPDYPARAIRQFVFEGLAHLPSVAFLGNLYNLNFVALYVLCRSDAGQFAVGYRVAIALFVLTSACMESVLPELTLEFKDAIPRIKRWGGRLLVLSLAAAAIVSLLAGPAAQFMFGNAYEASVSAIRWLSWTLPALVLCAVLHTALLAGGSAGSAAWTMAGLTSAGAIGGAAALITWGPFALAMTPAVVGTLFLPILWRQVKACRPVE